MNENQVKTILIPKPLPRRRLVWVDATKGLAIILVVFGHVLGGAMARGWLEHGGLPLITYEFLYLFHMPLFFLIGGAFAIDTVRRDPRAAFLARLGTILWPYVLWGALDILLDPIVDRFRGFPHNDPNLWAGFKHLLLGEASWFLWTFFLAHCVLILTRTLPSLMVMALSLAAYVLLSQLDLGSFGAVIAFLPYMAMGALIGRDNLSTFFCSRWSSPVFGLVLLGGLFGVAAIAHKTSVLSNPIIAFSCGVLGSFAMIMIARGYQALRIESVLAICGAASLVVFLLHPYFQGISRIFVLRIFGTVAWAQLGLCTLMAVVGPVLVWWASEKWGGRWLFRLNLSDRKEQLAPLANPKTFSYRLRDRDRKDAGV